jgi:hypothetical protein
LRARRKAGHGISDAQEQTTLFWSQRQRVYFC